MMIHQKTLGIRALNDAVYITMMEEYYVWLLSRYIGSSGMQPVPELGVFISATGTHPPRKSTVDYFTLIHQPIIDNTVVRELLNRSEVATAEVGQTWVLKAVDMGVCTKELSIIWRWTEEFVNHMIHELYQRPRTISTCSQATK